MSDFDFFLKKTFKISRPDFKIAPDIRKALILLYDKYDGDIFNSKFLDVVEDSGLEVAESSGVAIIGKTQVLKYQYIKNPRFPKKYRAPTFVLDKIGKTLRYQLCVQPKLREATDNIINKVDWYVNFGQRSGSDDPYDVRLANVGLYKKQLLAFDW